MVSQTFLLLFDMNMLNNWVRCSKECSSPRIHFISVIIKPQVCILEGGCGGFNVIGSHKLIENDTISRFRSIGGSMSLLVKALRFPMLKILPRMSVEFMLPTRYRNSS